MKNRLSEMTVSKTNPLGFTFYKETTRNLHSEKRSSGFVSQQYSSKQTVLWGGGEIAPKNNVCKVLLIE